MTRLQVSFAFLTVLMASVAGCSTVDIAGRKPAPFASADHPAVRCVCLWQEAKGQAETGEITRGFAGQVYFFTADDQSSVGVEGDVHVFLFDDHGSPDQQARPISESGFANVEWQAMRRDSQLGPTYSLFVPYPRAGNLEANCALRLRLTQPDGSTLFSEMTQVKLPGLARQKRMQEVSQSRSRLIAMVRRSNSPRRGRHTRRPGDHWNASRRSVHRDSNFGDSVTRYGNRQTCSNCREGPRGHRFASEVLRGEAADDPQATGREPVVTAPACSMPWHH